MHRSMILSDLWNDYLSFYSRSSLYNSSSLNLTGSQAGSTYVYLLVACLCLDVDLLYIRLPHLIGSSM